MSVGWHALAAVLLFAGLRLMTGWLWGSAVVAAVFAVHPLQVESVAWAVERSNVLAGFFFGLTLVLWARYARRPGAGRYAAALLAFALGLAAKPLLVTLPPLLLVLDFWPLGRAHSWRRLGLLGLEKLPLLLLAAGAGTMAVLAHRQAGWLASLEALPLGTRLANAALSYWRYAGKAFWPADLAVYYPHPGRGVPWGLGLAAGLALTVVTGLALAGWPRRPWLGAGWLWFAGMLVPASGVVQFGDHAMADRFAYLSLAGLVLPLTWTAREIASGRPNVARALPATAVACIGLLSGITVAQVRLWRDSETLFRHTLAVTGENWCAEGNLAIVLKDQGRFAESLLHLRAAARIRPADPEVHNITGVVLGKMARHEEAIAAFSEALRLRPVYPEARRNLGHALLQLGRDAEAVAQLEDALRGLPPDPVESTNLGGALSRLGRQEQALAWFRAALELQPGLLEARFNEGCALLELGRFREAAASFAAVVRDQPGDGEARTYLAKALAGAAGHDREEARRHRR